MQFLSYLFSRFVPAELRLDAAAHGRAQNLVVFALVALVAGLPIAGLHAFLGGMLCAVLILAGMVVMVGAAMSLRLGFPLELASIHGVAAMYGVFVVMAWAGGGEPTLATLAWFGLVPVVASFVGGVRQGLLWGVAALVAPIAFNVAAVTGHPVPPSTLSHPEVLSSWLTVVFVAVMATVAVLFQLSKERVEEQLEHLALFDGLTGLPNRRNLHLRAPGALLRSRRSKSALAVMFLDLDGFKSINDQHGHAFGDAVLKAFAQRLRDAVRASDAVCRLAGDEFVIVLEQLTHAREAARVAQHILAEMAVPLLVGPGRTPLRVGTSIGIAFVKTPPNHIEPLLSAADKALYAAKGAGRGRFEFAATVD